MVSQVNIVYIKRRRRDVPIIAHYLSLRTLAPHEDCIASYSVLSSPVVWWAVPVGLLVAIQRTTQKQGNKEMR